MTSQKTRWGFVAVGTFVTCAIGAYSPATADAQSAAPSSTCVAQYVPLAPMPAHDGTPVGPWLTADPEIIKDVQGGDLVAFFEGNTSLHAAVSKDNGTSWSWVDGPNVGALGVPGVPGPFIQDDDGKVQLIYFQVGAIGYARLTLARDGGGHVTGFSVDANVALPTNVNTSGYVRTQLVAGKDGAGNRTLVYVTYDENSAGGRIQAGKTSVSSGWLPQATADFVSLSNAAGATTIATLPFVNGFEGSHNASVQLAQHPISRDLWFQWGPIDTTDGITGNTNHVVRLRATPSGTGWTLGTPSTVEPFAGGFAAGLGSVYTTPNFVWLMHFSPSRGLVIDRAASDGTVVDSAIPSPLTTPHSGGYISLVVDATTESRAYAGGWISSDSAGGADFWAKYWNGSSWQTFEQPNPPGDVNGIGHSVGWNGGLALVQLDANTSGASMATLRTQCTTSLTTAQPTPSMPPLAAGSLFVILALGGSQMLRRKDPA